MSTESQSIIQTIFVDIAFTQFQQCCKPLVKNILARQLKVEQPLCAFGMVQFNDMGFLDTIQLERRGRDCITLIQPHTLTCHQKQSHLYTTSPLLLAVETQTKMATSPAISPSGPYRERKTFALSCSMLFKLTDQHKSPLSAPNHACMPVVPYTLHGTLRSIA